MILRHLDHQLSQLVVRLEIVSCLAHDRSELGTVEIGIGQEYLIVLAGSVVRLDQRNLLQHPIHSLAIQDSTRSFLCLEPKSAKQQRYHLAQPSTGFIII